MAQLDTAGIFSRKFNVIEYGNNHPLTWQYIKSQMRSANPAAMMEMVLKL